MPATTQKQIANHLDLSVRQVQRLMKDGVLPGSKGSRGYDLDACRFAYITYLRSRAGGDTQQPQSLDLDDAELKRKQEEANLRLTEQRALDLEIKNERNAGKLIPTAFVIFAMTQKVIPEISSLLDSLPLTMKRKHPDLQQRHLNALEREITRLRNMAGAHDEKALSAWIDEYTRLNPD